VTTSPLPEASPAYLRVKHGDRFSPVGLRPYGGGCRLGLGMEPGLRASPRREWWFETARGVLRFAAAARPGQAAGSVPYQIFDRSTGLGETDIFRVFEDSRRESLDLDPEPAQRAGPLGARNRTVPSTGLWPTAGRPTPSRRQFRNPSLARSGSHVFWKWCVFVNGRFEKFAMPSNGPLSLVRDLFIDRAGRIWVATAHNGLYLLR